jgi:hypothetical protein
MINDKMVVDNEESNKKNKRDILVMTVYSAVL